MRMHVVQGPLLPGTRVEIELVMVAVSTLRLRPAGGWMPPPVVTPHMERMFEVGLATCLLRLAAKQARNISMTQVHAMLCYVEPPGHCCSLQQSMPTLGSHSIHAGHAAVLQIHILRSCSPRGYHCLAIPATCCLL